MSTERKMLVVKGRLETTTAEFKAVSRTLVIRSLVPEQTFNYFIEQVFYDFKSFQILTEIITIVFGVCVCVCFASYSDTAGIRCKEPSEA